MEESSKRCKTLSEGNCVSYNGLLNQGLVFERDGQDPIRLNGSNRYYCIIQNRISQKGECSITRNMNRLKRRHD